MARRGVGMARGLGPSSREPVTVPAAEAVVTDEVARPGPRFLASLDDWCGRSDEPDPAAADARRVRARRRRAARHREGLVAALSSCATPACTCRTRSTTAEIDGGGGARRSRSRRPTSSTRSSRGRLPGDDGWIAQRPERRSSCRSRGSGDKASSARSSSIGRCARRADRGRGCPCFRRPPGSAPVMKTTAGGNRPERWFSQVPVDLEGISSHKQLANKFLPALERARARGPAVARSTSPPRIPSRSVRWLVDALAPERCRRAHRLRELAHGRGALGERARHRRSTASSRTRAASPSRPESSRRCGPRACGRTRRTHSLPRARWP